MKITATQIEQLYAFTRQHFVEYYDLQTELVDHLANAIEAKSAENPTLTFDEILQSEFKKFGIFGFMEVVENRKKALTRKYHKIVWKHFLEFFKLPKIAIVIVSFVLVLNALKYLQSAPEMYVVVFAILTLFLLGKSIADNYKKKEKQPEKRWLFEEIVSGYGSITAFFVVPVQLLNSFSRNSETMFNTTASMYGFSVFLVAYAVICYIITVIIPSKAKEYLAQTYPEYALMQ
ncbi:MAG: hypothetical protein PSV16_01885 [Flavobacterium sp.]|nr:hypothetical protein [Flavobacterium sp.]